MDKIKKALEEPLKEIGLTIYSINYEKSTLNIILDSTDDKILDLDKIVEATHIINKVLDKNDFIKESYTLDVSSRERGDV